MLAKDNLVPVPKPGSPALQGVSSGAGSGTSRVGPARIHEVQHIETCLKASRKAGGDRGARRLPARCAGSCTDGWETEDAAAIAARSSGAMVLVHLRPGEGPSV